MSARCAQTNRLGLWDLIGALFNLFVVRSYFFTFFALGKVGQSSKSKFKTVREIETGKWETKKRIEKSRGLNYWGVANCRKMAPRSDSARSLTINAETVMFTEINAKRSGNVRENIHCRLLMHHWYSIIQIISFIL